MILGQFLWRIVMHKYPDEFVRQLREEKKTATVTELSSKYRMSKHAMKYLIYNRKLEPLYQEVKEASWEVKAKTAIIKKILKAFGR